MEKPQLYDVVGSIDDQLQVFAKAEELDRAQTIKDELTANGIGGARTNFDGFQSGIQNAQTVSNLAVVRAADSGSALLATTTEELTVTESASSSDGSFQFLLGNIPTDLPVTTVNASSFPDVRYEIINKQYLRLFNPILTLTDSVSATYQYETTASSISGTDSLTPDSATSIFTLSNNYDRGSVAITASPSGAYVIEGGGKLVEVARITDRVKSVLQTGEIDVDLSYTYSSLDQETVPASATFRDADELYIKNVVPPAIQKPPFE